MPAKLPGRQAGEDPWHAMHHFAAEVARATLGPDRHSPAVALMDRDGEYSVRLERTEHGESTLRFDTEAGRLLYRQVHRERSLALAQPAADNRLSALAPQVDLDGPQLHASPQAAQGHHRPRPLTREEQKHLRDARQEVLARLEVPGDKAAACGPTPLDRAVVDRANPEQLDQLRLAGTREALDDGLRQVRHAIEQEVTQPPNGNQTRPSGQGQGQAGHIPVDERFTAESGTLRTDYWFRDRPDRLGFTQTWLTLATAEHSQAVVTAMVDRARELGWSKLHLSGTPEFRREAWIMASARGLQTSGYVATHGDREAASAEAQRLNRPPRDNSEHRIRPPRQTTPRNPEPETTLHSRTTSEPARDKQLNALITKALRDARVPPELRASVREALMRESRSRLQAGATWNPRVYDANAPRRQASQSAAPLKPRQVQRDR